MSAYTLQMAERCREGFAQLFRGINELIFTDFPDYPNVGDSAIALGTLRYIEDSNIRLRAIYCVATLSDRVFSSGLPVYINGGGNIAGMYPLLDAHRYEVAQRLDESVLLVQGPQSVHFPQDCDRTEFEERFMSRRGLRIGVRDERSLGELMRVHPGRATVLMPDAVHLLGDIDSPEPTQRAIYLIRTDDESTGGKVSGIDTVDWLTENRWRWAQSAARWRMRRQPLMRQVLNPGISGWRRIAHQRLRRGVSLLSVGEVVITDRLHAMLIALQMGRQVIAIDNNNCKLSKYADAWFGTSCPDVRFANSITDAQRIVSV